MRGPRNHRDLFSPIAVLQQSCKLSPIRSHDDRPGAVECDALQATATGAVGGAKLHGPAVVLLIMLAAGLLFYAVGKDLVTDDAESSKDAPALPVPALEPPSKRILIAEVQGAEVQEPAAAEVADERPTPIRQIN